MTTYNIFGTTASGATYVTSPANATLGTEWYVTSQAWVTQLRFYRPNTAVAGAVVGAIYKVSTATTGVQVTPTTSFTLSGTGYQTATLTTPFQPVINQHYRVAIYFPTNRPDLSGYWTSRADIVNGPLVAPKPANAVGGIQEQYDLGTALAYPGTGNTQHGNSWCDVVVTDVDPTGGTGRYWSAKLDGTVTTNVAAGYQDLSYNRQTAAGDDTASGIAWPISLVSAPGGRQGQAIPYALPTASKRYEGQPNHQDFGDGDNFYFGQAFYLGTGFPTAGGSYQVIEQMRQVDTTGSPAMALEIRSGQIRLSGQYGILGASPASQYQYDLLVLDAVQVGVWYYVVYRMSFSTAAHTSTIDMWVNGTQRISSYTIPGPTVIGGRTYRKQGLYHDPTLGAATVYQAGQAFGTSYAAVDPTGFATQQGAATLPGSGSVTSPAQLGALAAGTLHASSTVAADAVRTTFGTIAALSAEGTVTATGIRTLLGTTITLAGESNVVTQPSVIASANPTATASISATAYAIRSVSAPLAAEANLQADAYRLPPVSATLTAMSALYADADVPVITNVPLSGEATATATAIIGQTAAATLSAQAGMVASVGRAATTSIRLDGGSFFNADVTREVLPDVTTMSGFTGMVLSGPVRSAPAAATLNAAAALSAPATVDVAALATLSGVGVIAPYASVPGPSAFLIAASSATVASPAQTMLAGATLPANTTVFADPNGTQFGQALLAAVSTFATDTPRLREVAAASLSGQTTIVSAALGERFAFATLPAVANLAVSAMAEIPLGATLSVLSTFTANMSPPDKQAFATLAAVANFTGAPQIRIPNSAELDGVSQLHPDGYTFTPVFVNPAGPPVVQSDTPTVRLLLADTMTGRVNYELPYTALSWTSTLNDAGAMTATLHVESVLDSLSAQGAQTPAQTIREFIDGAYRFSLAVVYGNDVLWAGPYIPSRISGSSPTIDIAGVEFEKIFEKRLMLNQNGVDRPNDPSWNVQTPSTSVPGLIYYALVYGVSGANRALPITCSYPPDLRGNEVSAYNGFDLVTVWKAVSDIIARSDGPDVRFDPYLYLGQDALYLNWDLRIGSPYLDVGNTFTWDDDTAIFDRATNADKMATRVFVPGDGQDALKQIGMSSDDTLTYIGYPALDYVDGNYTSTDDLGQLDSLAAGDIAAYSQPTDEWSLKVPMDGIPPAGAYRRGDVARIEIRSHLLIEPGTYFRRITSIAGDATPWLTMTCDPIELDWSPTLPSAYAADYSNIVQGNQAASGVGSTVTWSVTRIGYFTGEDSPNLTVTKAAVGACDLGIPFDNGRGEIILIWGDTFSDVVGGADWRSNVVAKHTNTDLTKGIKISWWHTDTANHADQVIARDNSADYTIIPTSGITVNNRSYVTYMSINNWGAAGVWQTNYAGFAYSDDGGVTWTKSNTGRWNNTAAFDDNWQMNALADGGDGYVYMYGTPNGRFGAAYVARCSNTADLLTITNWQQYAGNDTWVAWRASGLAAVVLPADVSELSIFYHAYSKQWLAGYYKQSINSMVVHTAPKPYGPWSQYNVVATGDQYPTMYGCFFHPWSTNIETPYFAMSQWPPYETELMQLRLGPSSGTASGGSTATGGTTKTTPTSPLWNSIWAAGNVNDGGQFQAASWEWQSTTPYLQSSVIRPGGNSLRIDMPANGVSNPAAGASAGSGVQRCEMDPNIAEVSAGATYYYRLDVMLASGFPINTTTWQLFSQWKNDGSGSPPVQLAVGNGNFYMQGHDASGNVTWNKTLQAAKTGTYYSFVIGIRFGTSTSTGAVTAWIDGTQVLPSTTLQTAYSGVQQYWKMGLYRDSAITTGSTIVFDRVCYGTSYDNVK